MKSGNPDVQMDERTVEENLTQIEKVLNAPRISYGRARLNYLLCFCPSSSRTTKRRRKTMNIPRGEKLTYERYSDALGLSSHRAALRVHLYSGNGPTGDVAPKLCSES